MKESHKPSKKLLVCIDGSPYADNICLNAAWAAGQLGDDTEIHLLHVLRRQSNFEAASADHTGSIGLGARSGLLDKLSDLDQERAKYDQQKGRIILDHGEALLEEAGIHPDKISTLHRRGSLVDTVKELEDDMHMVFIGKRGEHANTNSEFLGANLEKTARAVSTPLFVVSSVMTEMKRFLIAYDGKESMQKIIDYVTGQPLLNGMECHLLAVDSSNTTIVTTEIERHLRQAGYDLTVTHAENDTPEEEITKYVEDQEIDLLAMGAYSHSRMRTLLLGSTTASLIKSCHVPLLLFK
jgi:nucleotide-binding universal stress UspA family protein